MASQQQNFSPFADRTWQIIVPIKDINGNNYNLGPGASANWGMAPSQTSTTKTLTKSTSTGGISIAFDGISLWTATVTVLPADTQNLVAQNYYHELVVMDSSGDVVNITTGILTLQASINQTPLV